MADLSNISDNELKDELQRRYQIEKVRLLNEQKTRENLWFKNIDQSIEH